MFLASPLHFENKMVNLKKTRGIARSVITFLSEINGILLVELDYSYLCWIITIWAATIIYFTVHGV